ncbi:hypothetical protein PR048_025447 [Dryococelus australis]|uniref:Uncharacterized protein n=1 Tax=Dryococelus australis TaxID=614101 RepID=A0ABQ9GRF2_9NEOP|nr:hypothetical protein PR048_025447 [Dryococelus australis]
MKQSTLLHREINLLWWKVVRNFRKSHVIMEAIEAACPQYCSLNVKLHTHILLPTATVKVYDNTRMLNTCRGLLDSCSQTRFVIESLVQRLSQKRLHNCVPLHRISTVKA